MHPYLSPLPVPPFLSLCIYFEGHAQMWAVLSSPDRPSSWSSLIQSVRYFRASSAVAGVGIVGSVNNLTRR